MKNKQVVIIDYGSGNLRSAEKAFQKVIADHDLPFDVIVSADTKAVKEASHIVLPGQGAFGDCMSGLQAVPDMIKTLAQEVLEKKEPFLGICVGMQLLADRGLEHGDHKGLGWISGEIVPIQPKNPDLKIPHMGWNVVSVKKPHFMVENQQELNESDPNSSPHFYFVHSFMFESKDRDVVLGYAEYGDIVIPAIIAKDNIVGIQCHPEKSQAAGLQFLYDFLLWNPQTTL